MATMRGIVSQHTLYRENGIHFRCYFLCSTKYSVKNALRHSVVPKLGHRSGPRMSIARTPIADISSNDSHDLSSPYVPLHVHSDFSLLDGASQLSGLVERAKELHMPALALTDHGVMYGAIQLVKLCESAGIKPIIGNEMYLVHADITDKPQGRANQHQKFHLTVLAKNTTGYQNLVQLTTISHLHGMQGIGMFARPCINRELLEKHKEGLIICSGCQSGEVPRAILRGDMEEAEKTVRWYQRVFGDDYYLEVMHHGRHENNSINDGIMALSQITGVKVLATNDSHFTRCQDHHSHQTLICIKTGQSLNGTKGLRYTGEEYLKSGSQLMELLTPGLGVEKAREVIARTNEVAQKVSRYNVFSEGKLPQFPVPPGHDESSWLEIQAWVGLCSALNVRCRGDIPEEYRTRLSTELSVIHSQGFSGYFLVVGDIIRFARAENIAVGPGRGSAAGSLVAYSLGIIGIDPVKYGLLFERFLNEERRSLPDIDTDFCPLQRDKVVEYVSGKYGADYVAQIVTFNRLTSKAVVRSVAKVIGMSYSSANHLAKLIPVVRGKAVKLKELVCDSSPVPEFLELYKTNDEVRRCIDLALPLEDHNRTFGVHAAGLVIAPPGLPLSQWVPLQRALGNQSLVLTQYAMEDIEAMGLLKFDILGLKNLTCISQTYSLLKATYGIQLPPLEQLPTDNQAAFQLMASGDVDGLFQLEASPGMRKVVCRLRPSCLEDVFAIVALYRPGPLDAGLVDTFIERKHGRQKVEYECPELEPILSETYGVLVYQEQIMRVARDLSGYTLGQADLLRRAMGKKKVSEMESQRSRFIRGAEERGIDPSVALNLFETMVKFAEYCFNKSHSAAYGYLTYVTAFLRSNFPVAYMTALLSCALGERETLQRYVVCCRRMNIALHGPCVNHSLVEFTIQTGALGGEAAAAAAGAGSNDGIRFGLAAVKGVGETVASHIVQARKEQGLFVSMADFCLRVQKQGVDNKKPLEALVLCGALDSLHWDRGMEDVDIDRDALKDQFEESWQWAKQRLTDRQRRQKRSSEDSLQSNLFDLLSIPVDISSSATAEGSDGQACQLFTEKMTAGRVNSGGRSAVKAGSTAWASASASARRWEKDLLGCYLGQHPLEFLMAALPEWVQPWSLEQCVEAEREEAGHMGKRTVMLAVEVGSLQLKVTRSEKKEMAIVGLEDASGKTCEGLLFPASYAALKSVVEEGAMLLIWGRLLSDRSRPAVSNEEQEPGAEEEVEVQVDIRGAMDLKAAQCVCIRLSVEQADNSHTQALLKSLLLSHEGKSAAGEGQQMRHRSRSRMAGADFRMGLVLPVPVAVCISSNDSQGADEMVMLGHEFNVADAEQTCRRLVEARYDAYPMSFIQSV